MAEPVLHKHLPVNRRMGSNQCTQYLQDPLLGTTLLSRAFCQQAQRAVWLQAPAKLWHLSCLVLAWRRISRPVALFTLATANYTVYILRLRVCWQNAQRRLLPFDGVCRIASVQLPASNLGKILL